MSNFKRDINITQLKNLFFYTFGIVPLDYYSVIGDGITDNRLQLQQAIFDAIDNNIKYIFVTKGEYYYSQTLERAEEIIWIGNSVETQIEGIEIKQFPELWRESSQISNQIAQIGSIVLFAGQSIPKGYLECNGQTLNVAEYSSLASVLGIEAEQTTFSVPDISSDTNFKYIIKSR